MAKNVENILLCFEGLDHKTSGSWNLCNLCRQDSNYRCSNSFAVLVDVNIRNPKILIKQLGKNPGEIDLNAGFNYFHWCVNTNSKIRISNAGPEADWFYENGWIVIQPQTEFSWIPINIPIFKSHLEGKTNGFIDKTSTLYNPTSRKLFRISQLNLLTKINRPPSLETYAKLTFLRNYTRGKPGNENFPCSFTVSAKKCPQSINKEDFYNLQLDAISTFELLTLHPYEPSFNPLELFSSDSEPVSEASSYDSTASSDSGIGLNSLS